MVQVKGGSTDPELLRRVRALRDDPAWDEFFAVYNPLVKDWCSAYCLDGPSVDEVRQRVWFELVRRMPTYQYDPGRTFRGWLRKVCHDRAMDLLRERQKDPVPILDAKGLVDSHVGADDGLNGDDAAPGRLLLFREAREVQDAVRRRVKPVRWEVFWRVVIEGEPMPAVADDLGLKYATAYAGANHVARLLREEGRRRAAQLDMDGSSPSREG
jgi:RNA polymerase sigma-70 factor (ECF subfamily)